MTLFAISLMLGAAFPPPSMITADDSTRYGTGTVARIHGSELVVATPLFTLRK